MHFGGVFKLRHRGAAYAHRVGRLIDSITPIVIATHTSKEQPPCQKQQKQ
jgi:hypothetical protein